LSYILVDWLTRLSSIDWRDGIWKVEIQISMAEKSNKKPAAANKANVFRACLCFCQNDIGSDYIKNLPFMIEFLYGRERENRRTFN